MLAASVPVMEQQTRGESIQARLRALGVTQRAFSEATGMDRKTLARAIRGDEAVTPRTYASIEVWLDQREAERRGTPLPTPDPHLVTFRLTGNFGVDVVVSGPVDNIEALEASVQRLVQGMGQTPPE